MPQMIMREEFLKKARTAQSFEELKSIVAAEGLEVADDVLAAKWEELSGQAQSKFKLSEEELDNVAGGCNNTTMWKCTSCGRMYYWKGIWDESDAPNCDECGSPMALSYYYEL